MKYFPEIFRAVFASIDNNFFEKYTFVFCVIDLATIVGDSVGYDQVSNL